MRSYAAIHLEHDVRDAHARWWSALLDDDVAALDTLLADDLTFHGPSGGTATIAAYLDRLRSGRLAYDSITAAQPLVRVHGVTAILTGRADIMRVLDDIRARLCAAPGCSNPPTTPRPVVHPVRAGRACRGRGPSDHGWRERAKYERCFRPGAFLPRPEELNLRQKAFGEGIGVSSVLVSLWASGRRPVPQRRDREIADVLGLEDLAELLSSRKV
jgi:hypothetical protein